jgi:hypothetical protein
MPRCSASRAKGEERTSHRQDCCIALSGAHRQCPIFRIYKNVSASLSNLYAATTNLQNGKMGSSRSRQKSTLLFTPISEAERVSK